MAGDIIVGKCLLFYRLGPANFNMKSPTLYYHVALICTAFSIGLCSSSTTTSQSVDKENVKGVYTNCSENCNTCHPQIIHVARNLPRIVIRGNHTCGVLILAPLNHSVEIDVLTEETWQNLTSVYRYLYIDLGGGKVMGTACKGRILAFEDTEDDRRPCKVTVYMVYQNQFMLYSGGDIAIQLTASGSYQQHKTIECWGIISDFDPSNNVSRGCQQYTTYDDVIQLTATAEDTIYADINNNDKDTPSKVQWKQDVTTCDGEVSCRNGCICTLGNRKLVTTNIFGNLLKETLIIYPTRPRKLHLSCKGLHFLEETCFRRFAGDLQELYLSNNSLKELPVRVFDGMVVLRILHLHENAISHIPLGLFDDLINLATLVLYDNRITVLMPGVFARLNALTILVLKNNQVRTDEPGTFHGLNALHRLHLEQNNLSNIQIGFFRGLRGMNKLNLQNNRLQSLHPDIFNGLPHLRVLNLWGNEIHSVAPKTFSNLNHLIALSVGQNRLTEIASDTYDNLPRLEFIDFMNNSIVRVRPFVFQGCPSLIVVDLRDNTLDWISSQAFHGLIEFSHLLVDNQDTCCHAKESICHPTIPPPVFLTCERLLQQDFLRNTMWLLGIGAVFGNVFVFGYRFKQDSGDNNSVQSFLIANLACSDMLLGVYMLIIGSVDLYYGEYFPSHAANWRRSSLCKIAGILAILSSEASVFFVTAISIDRCIGVKYPFGEIRLPMKGAKIVVCLLWTTAILVSFIPNVLLKGDSEIYDVSEVCIGLPLSRSDVIETNITQATLDFNITRVVLTVYDNVIVGKITSMYFSIALFIGVNLLCFLIIAVSYIVIFYTVQQTAASASRCCKQREEIRMAIKMSIIVLTDFCCWMPLIVLSILVQCGVVRVSPVTYAWVATFILPINSAVNPFLYTITNKLSQYRKERSDKSSLQRTSRGNYGKFKLTTTHRI